MFVRPRLLSALGCALALAQSLSCRGATQVTVEISTDLSCDTLAQTGLVVGKPGALGGALTTVTEACAPSATGSRVGSIVVVPRAEKDAAFEIAVVASVRASAGGAFVSAEQCWPGGEGRSNCIVARRSLRFRPHEDLVLPVFLSGACQGKECPSGQTCSFGACVSDAVDPGTCPGGSCGPGASSSGAAGGGGFGGGAGGGGGLTGSSSVGVGGLLNVGGAGGFGGVPTQASIGSGPTSGAGGSGG